MKAEDVLFTQGFGTRYDCRSLIASGKFEFNGEKITDPDKEISISDGMGYKVGEDDWKFFIKGILAMNKPPHFECSLKPRHYPGVSSLLPGPLRKRGMQPVGRLDEDTTGLLIFTDDGKLNHTLTHPKKHIRKIYEVTAKHPITQEFLDKLLAGVMLNDEKEVLKADLCEKLDENKFLLGISQGKYHQVKRMVAAASNRVEGLKRVQVGKFRLPDSLPEGKWMWIENREEIL